jgi:hypothetical protein
MIFLADMWKIEVPDGIILVKTDEVFHYQQVYLGACNAFRNSEPIFLIEILGVQEERIMGLLYPLATNTLRFLDYANTSLLR